MRLVRFFICIFLFAKTYAQDQTTASGQNARAVDVEVGESKVILPNLPDETETEIKFNPPPGFPIVPPLPELSIKDDKIKIDLSPKSGRRKKRPRRPKTTTLPPSTTQDTTATDTGSTDVDSSTTTSDVTTTEAVSTTTRRKKRRRPKTTTVAPSTTTTSTTIVASTGPTTTAKETSLTPDPDAATTVASTTNSPTSTTVAATTGSEVNVQCDESSDCETQVDTDTDDSDTSATDADIDIDVDVDGDDDDEDGDDQKEKQLLISNSKSKVNNTVKQKTRVLPITVNLTADVLLDLLVKLGQNALKEGILKGGLGGLLAEVIAPLSQITKDLSGALGPINLGGGGGGGGGDGASLGGLDLLLSPQENPLVSLLGLASELQGIANQPPPPPRRPKERPVKPQEKLILIENKEPANEIIIEREPNVRRDVSEIESTESTVDSSTSPKVIPVRVNRSKEPMTQLKDVAAVAAKFMGKAIQKLAPLMANQN